MFQPYILALEDGLKQERERPTNSVVATARIPFSFAAKTHIEDKNNLYFK